MSEPFVENPYMFAKWFAPRGLENFVMVSCWRFHKMMLLFSLLEQFYGGDGRTTFGLPDMRGDCQCMQEQVRDLVQRRLGTKFGAENVTLTVNQMPSSQS